MAYLGAGQDEGACQGQGQRIGGSLGAPVRSVFPRTGVPSHSAPLPWPVRPQNRDRNRHCEERDPSPVIARSDATKQSRGSGQAPQSDLKGHSERSEESRGLPRLRLATTLRVGLPRTLWVLAMTNNL